jgi:hypothetical protein
VALVIILFGVLVWPGEVLTGGDDEPSEASSGNGQQASGSIPTGIQGSAFITRQGGQTRMVVQATGLEPSTQDTAYQVWLYNSNNERKSLGATATDQQGNLQAIASLPAGYEDYRFVDLTSVTVERGGQNPSFETGPSVLRGLLELRDKPITRGEGKNRISLLGEIRMRPLPE